MGCGSLPICEGTSTLLIFCRQYLDLFEYICSKVNLENKLKLGMI